MIVEEAGHVDCSVVWWANSSGRFEETYRLNPQRYESLRNTEDESTFLRNVRKQFTQTYGPTSQKTCLLSAKTGLQNETFDAMSFPVDRSVNLRTSLADLSLQCSLSLFFSGQGGRLLSSSLNLYLNRRCGEHSTLPSNVSLSVTPTHRNTRTHVSCGKVSSEWALALKKKSYTYSLHGAESFLRSQLVSS